MSVQQSLCTDSVDTELYDLVMKLVNCEKEEEVISVLQQYDYWDSPNCWKYYGDKENNFSIIGNQMAKADAALVEKLTNSVDAMLIGACLERGISPEADEAPQSIASGMEEFFGIKDGRLTNLDSKSRSELAENIILMATGSKSSPCFTIIDKGEGQTPLSMPGTILSLAESVKLRVPFVQGKFNMGGSGVLQFCGKHNLQLIISKRDPLLVDLNSQDSTAEFWGFTIVRRENPTEGVRSSSYKYLAPHGCILKFRKDSLPVLPGKYPTPYENPLSWGTYIKLYEYQIGSYRTNIVFDLYYRLSLLLPTLALPIKLCERRKGYKGHSFDTVLTGLSVRLDEDRSMNLEPDFPSSSQFSVRGNKYLVRIYAFKKEKGKKGTKTKFGKRDGIVFVINGQARGFISDAFFSRNTVGMSYLADSLLIIVDCSEIDGRTREDLFMNSRDRLRDNELKKHIEAELEKIISDHQGLKDLRERRRREDLEEDIGGAKPLIEVLEKVIQVSPTLSRLFDSGKHISNPFKKEGTGGKAKFVGKEFPSFFKLEKEHPLSQPKFAPINQRFRLKFDTDAENDYFTRDKNPGVLELYLLNTGEKVLVSDIVFNLWNGIGNLTVSLPEGCKVGDYYHYQLEVNDISRIEAFEIPFFVQVLPEEVKTGSNHSEKRDAPGKDKIGNRNKPNALGLPLVHEVGQQNWENHGFDEESALKVYDNGTGGYDFYVNIDNKYLNHELKYSKVDAISADVMRAQFKFGMVILGLSLLKHFTEKNILEECGAEISHLDHVGIISRGVAPVLVPLIKGLSEISRKDIAETKDN